MSAFPRFYFNTKEDLSLYLSLLKVLPQEWGNETVHAHLPYDWESVMPNWTHAITRHHDMYNQVIFQVILPTGISFERVIPLREMDKEEVYSIYHQLFPNEKRV